MVWTFSGIGEVGSAGVLEIPKAEPGNKEYRHAHFRTLHAYCKKRYKNSRLKLPKEIESMIYLEVANSFEGEEEKENRQKWRLRAYDNSNNSKEIQELISDCMEKDSTFDISMIWQIINKRFEK